MKIEKLEKVPTRKEIFKLSFDSGENVILSADIIVKFSLNNGVVISKETYKEVLAADKAYRVTYDALNLISRSSYSSKTLCDKLLQKGYELENAKAAVARLKELGYINDDKYALEYTKYLLSKGKGEFAIKAALAEKGASKEQISNALELTKTEEEPFERIIKIMKTRFKNFDAKDQNEIRRAASFFLRRGFTSQDIAKALREYKNIIIE
ncbi:regulatory protein RecX [Endomicrobium proavitum]|uniref:Regulatory protein RecX n=1 Tax=Endomicrobium proavitum TaxID=1408281 RepID=A0A0G3WK46_9BACT|nr:regulatory protein RecX [Endomicrobium proavitum]AKL97874.1 Regulatory protein RecX [Endomicrobium proavitum]